MRLPWTAVAVNMASLQDASVDCIGLLQTYRSYGTIMRVQRFTGNRNGSLPRSTKRSSYPPSSSLKARSPRGILDRSSGRPRVYGSIIAYIWQRISQFQDFKTSICILNTCVNTAVNSSKGRGKVEERSGNVASCRVAGCRVAALFQALPPESANWPSRCYPLEAENPKIACAFVPEDPSSY